MPKKFSKNKEAEVHKSLKGFDINIDSFGQMKYSMNIESLNTFLDKDNSLKSDEEE